MNALTTGGILAGGAAVGIATGLALNATHKAPERKTVEHTWPDGTKETRKINISDGYTTAEERTQVPSLVVGAAGLVTALTGLGAKLMSSSALEGYRGNTTGNIPLAIGAGVAFAGAAAYLVTSYDKA